MSPQINQLSSHKLQAEANDSDSQERKGFTCQEHTCQGFYLRLGEELLLPLLLEMLLPLGGLLGLRLRDTLLGPFLGGLGDPE